MIDKNTAEHYTWGAGCDGWRLVDRSEMSVIQERMPPGTAEARHYHHAARQFFFVLSGVAVLEVAGRRQLLGARQGAEVAPGTPHQIFNQSDQDVEFLVISHPSTRADRVAADAAP